jgi:hypothetical protein
MIGPVAPKADMSQVHSMTSLAVAKIAGGTRRPNSFAAFRLRTISTPSPLEREDHLAFHLSKYAQCKHQLNGMPPLLFVSIKISPAGRILGLFVRSRAAAGGRAWQRFGNQCGCAFHYVVLGAANDDPQRIVGEGAAAVLCAACQWAVCLARRLRHLAGGVRARWALE